MDFKNSDIANGLDVTSLMGADASASLEGAALLKMALQSGNIMPLTADGQLVLPAGVGLDDIKVVGRDLIIQMPDGTQMIVPDGAIIVPQIVVDGVAIPALNFAALLAGQEPQPAAGLPQSSGGNFADNVGDIGDPFALGDLLPPTQLAFPQPEEREVVPGLVDRDPDVIIQDGGPAGRDVIDNVNETGLPGTRANGNVESPGSAAGNGSDSTTGTIFVTSPDGIASITINGVVVTGAAGQQITTPLGVLTLSALNGDQIGYTYRLLDNTSGDTTTDAFLVSLTDPDGDVATARLTINIADDVPTARNDIDSLAGGTFGPELGNVLTGAGTISGLAGADTLGADGAAISGFRAGASGSFAAVGSNITGQYGTLTLGANGSYSYVRNVNTPGGVTDVFTYQLTDTDGDASTATLTINIGDAPNRITFIPDIGDGTIVREPHLPARDSEPSGSQFDGNAEATSGTITFNSPDGVGNVTVAGAVLTPGALPQLVSSNATGSLLVTAYTYNPVTGIGSITYVYTLNDNTLNTNGESLSFPIVVTDLDGDVASDSLIIKIVDDAPLAANDSGTQQSENAPVSINVFVNDTPGADGINLATGVSVVAGSLTGAGALAYSNNGIFTYTPAPGEEGVVTFQYVITDGDGDTSTATVTISLLEDSLPSVEVDGENVVSEAGLPSGSDAASNSETTGGTIAIATGGDALASLVINSVNVTAGGILTGASGTLTVSVSQGVYSYSYTLTDNTSGDATTDSFNVIVTDSDGDSATDTLVIAIQDDVPSAADDADAIAAGTYGPVTGNVITDAEGDGGADTPGADGATVTTVMGSTAGAVGGTTAGTYGVLVLNADGSYIYTRNAGTEGGVSDVFTYTLIDGDGDIAIATLTISIADSPTTLDLPTAGEAGTLVDEAGLANGDSTNETTSGSFAFTAPDGPATVTLDGQAVTSVGQIFAGSFGILTVTSIANGAIGYSYTLTTNTAGDTTFDDFAVVVTDQDGDATAGTLVIDIIDDVPTARADIDSVTEDGPTVADGNVITGANVADANSTDGVADTQGADGVSLTAFSFGANAGVVGSALAGTYGSLTMNANGSYSYALNNANAAVQGLDGDDSLTEVFTYTITDGDGDTSTTTLTVTINGSDDPITINGLSVSGPDLIVDEDDLLDGSSPNTPALTQNGTFTVNGVDGIASIKIGGVETFVGQTITNAYGTFTITSLSAPANGNATAITVGYRYVLTDNTAHANADNENFITEIFSVAVTDTDGSTDTDQVEVRIIDDVPTAVNDTDIIASGSNLPAVGNVITDAELDGGKDTAGADTVIVTAITGAAAGTVGGSTAGTYGVLTLNADGSYSYLRNDGTPGNVQDVFSYTITDGDGDTSTATLTITIQDDSPFVGPNAVVLLDDDALAGGNPGGNGDDSDAANVAGTLSGSGGDGALTFAYQLTGAPTGFNYVAGPSGSVLVKQGGTTVLTVTLNSATGAYTVTQNAPIAHAAGGDENNAPFTLSYTVTDVDGDAANGTLVVNVDDDTPVVTANGAVPTLTVDETVLGDDASASFAGIFTTNYGADGAGATVYTLGVVAGPSGLVDTATGQAVNLLLNGSVVEGRTAVSNELVFTVTVNGSGTVTLDQQRAVVHAPNSGPDQSTTLSAANLITLTATSTDGDGDTASATANIANALTFKDDAPAIDAAVVDANTVLLTTQDAETIGDLSDTSVSAANFGAAFTIASSSYGADGAGTTTWAYALSVTDANSGLASNGVAITLGMNGNVLEGRAGGALIFTLATNPTTGVVTLTQLAEIDHAVEGTTTAPFDDQFAVLANGKVALTGTATIVDKDGDSASEAVVLDLGGNVRFADDGPAVTALGAVPALVVDETVLATNASASFAGIFTTNYGADGAGATVYTLGVVAGPSGLVDTATGQAVNLLLNGSVVEGRTAVSNELVFTVTVNGSGTVTLDQQRAVVHAPNSGPDQSTTLSAANLITLTATSTDGDGDTASATANIANALTFKDDAPAIDAAVVDANTVLLTTQDAETIGDLSDTSVSAANFGAAFTIASSSYGADGAGTTTWAYALSVTDANSGLASNGVAITLGMNGNVLEGRAGGALIFTLATNPTTGVVTLTQLAEIDHAVEGTTTAPFDDQFAVLANGKVALTGTATIVDKDGDSASEAVVLDLGGNVRFADDGPTVSALGAVPTLTVDETVLGDDASASFAGIFTTNYGADGAGATVYTLGVVAGPSGLVDTATGQAVNLLLNGSVVEGRTAVSNELVFTVTVNGSGTVTLDQQRAVVHAPNSGPDQSTTLSAANLITLTATSTDGDGDTASATANIANALTFKDDAPAIDAAVVDANTVLLTTQDAETIGDLSDTSVSAANFGAAFTIASSSYGADGAGTTTWAYALSVTDANSGLASNGVAITLGMNGNVLEGRAGGALIFTLATNPTTGVVTLTQLAEIDHAVEGTTTAPFDDQFAVLANGKVALTGTATIVDKDGDSASEAVVLDLGGNVRFADDGPTVSALGAVPTLTVDETVLGDDASASFAGIFTTNYGADGAGATVYTLGVVAGPSGLVDTATGQAVNLLLNGSVVEGRTAVSNELVFTVTVNGSGTVTLDQQRAVVHAPNSGPDQSTTLSAANLITLTATSTDGDGDTASATANIANALTFKDDAGSLGTFVGITVVNAANTIGNGTFTYTQGADGHGSFAITGPALLGITYTTVQNANGALLTATTDPDGAGGNPPITVFTLQVNSNGTYAFTLVTPSAASTETISLLGLTAGGPTPFVETPDGRVEFTGSGNGVNSSTQGFGVDNQFVGNGESFTIEFHDPGQVGNQAPLTNPDYVSSITLRNDNINGSLLIKVTVFNDNLGTQEVVYTNLNVTGTATVIDPIMNEFNRVLVEGVGGSGQGVRFTSLDISRTILPSDINLMFDVAATDRDGDTTSTSTLNVFVDATAPVVLDIDGDGVEFLGITSGVTFDYHGDGSAESTAWVGSDDGLLALDRNGDGIVNDGSEIVFARDGLTDLQGLAADYDSNRDGVLDANDVDFAKFGVWQDANSNGITDAGEYRSLSDAGIVSIGLVSDGIAYSTANGSVSVAGQSVYAKADGSTGIVADAAFATNGTTSVVSRSADQIRTSNATTSVIAAALLGLSVAENAAAMPDGNLDQLGALVSENPGIGNEVASLASTGGASFISDLAFKLTHDFAQRPHDVASSLRPSEEAEVARSFQDAPMAERSALLEDKADPVSDDQGNFAVAFGGGDQVMHSMLDIAAFSASTSAGAGENAALPLPIEDALREAMPDLMVDRLIDAFTAALGVPANDVGGGANDSALLAGILSQGVDAFQLAALASNDLSGAHHYDMAMISNG
ncbi:MAG: cadherin-like domain-containing protein [Sphingorhabdus sp.]|uniref:DUF5801 repeats-in-toxin domain-containing protein n=1 Tax=Sphingorhabdus sp. TaxID=1902408 RepID=UPI0025F37075|nr:DUF5801 repeats-in-toxin domain-containing protein [Sphingorhabdus sp.]MCO4091142.1 cadherin-like domain-containing protein [Sphingorhabdus sp.]